MDLRAAALSGFRWMAVVRVVAETVAFVSTIALARLVAPAEYGRAVIALAFAVVIGGIFQEGLVAPLVQLAEASERHVRAAVAMALGAGTLLALLLALPLPPALAPVFGERTAFLVRLLFPVALLEGVNVVPRALLQRRLDFKRLGAVEVFGALASSVSAVALAAAGLGATAIVIGAVLQSALQSALLVRFAGLPRPAWDRSLIRELLGFGTPAALSTVVFQIWRNIDYVIVGARLGPAQTGLYWRSWALAFEYQGKLSGIMLRLAFPLYARSDSLDQMLRMRARIVRAHTTALFPALVGLIVLAPTLVPFVYGPGWTGAVEPTQLLAVGGMCAVVLTGTGPLLMATNHPRLLLGWNTGHAVVYAALVWVVAPSGLNAVAAAVSGFTLVSLVLTHIMLDRLVGLKWRAVLSELAPATVSAAVMAPVALALVSLFERAGASALTELAGVALGGGVAYVLTLRVAFRSAWSDVRLLAGSLVRRRAEVV